MEEWKGECAYPYEDQMSPEAEQNLEGICRLRRVLAGSSASFRGPYIKS